MTVSDLLEQPCNKSDNINTVVNNLGQVVRTQLVDGLLADLLQDACVVYYVKQCIFSQLPTWSSVCTSSATRGGGGGRGSGVGRGRDSGRGSSRGCGA